MFSFIYNPRRYKYSALCESSCWIGLGFLSRLFGLRASHNLQKVSQLPAQAAPIHPLGDFVKTYHRFKCP